MSKKLLALIFGVSIALAADFSVRQLYLLFWKKPFRDVAPLRQPDPYYHHGIRPSSQGVDIYGPYSAEYFSNSLGLRDEKIRQISLQTDQPRILLIGDSFTEAGPILWEKTFAGRLASALSPEVEVLNAGVASYCPTLERIKLRRLLDVEGLRVDRVVLFLDISDLKDEFYYEEDEEGRARSIPYGPYRDRADQLRRIDQACYWLEKNIEKNFVILGAVVRNARLAWRRQASATGVTEVDAIPEWAYNWPDYRGPYEPLVEAGLVKIKKEMSRLALEMKKRGVPLSVVVYPWPQQVKAGTRPSRAETEWRAWAQENEAQFISLFPVFVNDVPAQEILSRYYWKNDSHWNEEGHRLVAQALLQPNGGIPLPARGTAGSKSKTGK